MIPDYRPRSGKIEWHITYRCNLHCRGCSRCAWMQTPHTRDMTLEDAQECIRQADALGWKQKPGPGDGAELPRVIIIGGEPTLHPQFMRFVELARKWTDTYPQVYSNGYTEATRNLLEEARRRYDASICNEGFKTAPRREKQDGSQLWHFDICVSPEEAGLPLTVCYCHSFSICGIGFDANGFSPCPIGLMISTVLGVEGITRNLADLFDEEKVYRMTKEICRHCGYEGRNRFGPVQTLGQFESFAAGCHQLECGIPASPVWKQAFQRMNIS